MASISQISDSCDYCEAFLLSGGKLPAASANAKVFKEECLVCCDSEYSPSGIDVCLHCFQAYCRDEHSFLHSSKTDHVFGVNIRRVIKKAVLEKVDDCVERPVKFSKLAINVPGGLQEPMGGAEEDYEDVTSVICIRCHRVLDPSHPVIEEALKSVLKAPNAGRAITSVGSWEMQKIPCKHCNQDLIQSCQHTVSMNGTKCMHCTSKKNLWLCLSCGHIGCGRMQFDTSGLCSGKGHALDHYNETKHPICVKLGTINLEKGVGSNGDCHCYDCDEEVENAFLNEHLAKLGVDLESIEKSEKTMEEIELEQNMQLDFSNDFLGTGADGVAVIPVQGPHLTGMENIGSSCYMNSVFQCFFALETVRNFYSTDEYLIHSGMCSSSNPFNCFKCQLLRLSHGLASGKFPSSDVPTSSYLPADSNSNSKALCIKTPLVTPRLFKASFCSNHREFSTMRQQDADEFWRFLIDLQELEDIKSSGVGRTAASSLSSSFEFEYEQKIKCGECNGVRFSNLKNSALDLPLPKHLRRRCREVVVENDGEREEIAFEDALKYFMEPESVMFMCPSCKKQTIAERSLRFASFPRVLVIVARRFEIEGYVVKKTRTKLVMPSDLRFNFESYVCKKDENGDHLLTAGENLLPEEDNVGADDDGVGVEKKKSEINPEFVPQLMEMGFSRIRAENALRITGNSGSEPALNYLFEHMEDDSLDVPFSPTPEKSATQFDPESVQMIMSMGFTELQVVHALNETSGDVARAADWLLAHIDILDTLVNIKNAESEAGEPSPTKNSLIRIGEEMDAPLEMKVPLNPKHPNFKLSSFISHLGSSVHSGHYVAFVKSSMDDGIGGQWVRFNDRKVSVLPNILTMPSDSGYVYFLEQDI